MTPFVWVGSRETKPKCFGTKPLSFSTNFIRSEIVKKISCSEEGFSEQDMRINEIPNMLSLVLKFIHRVKNCENIVQLGDNQ